MPQPWAFARRIDEAIRSKGFQPPADLPRRGFASGFHDVLPGRDCVRKVDTGCEEDCRVAQIDDAMGLHAKFQQDELGDTTLGMSDHRRVDSLRR
nr:hypothetical protein BJQ95_02750 [Cryobacterium sp. SO1]